MEREKGGNDDGDNGNDEVSATSFYVMNLWWKTPK